MSAPPKNDRPPNHPTNKTPHPTPPAQKSIETQLREALEREAFLSDVIHNTSLAIGIGYPDGRFELLNEAALRLLGYSKEEARSLHWSHDLTPPRWHKVEAEQLALLQKTGRSVQYEKEYIHRDGNTFPVELMVHPRFNEQGEFECYVAFITDISERKEQEAALRENRATLSNIIEHSNDIFYLRDTQHTPQYVSPQSQKILGYSPAEMIMMGGWEQLLTDNPHNKKNCQSIREALETGEKQPPYLFEVKRKDGRLALLEMDESPVRDERGQITGIAGAARDVTEKNSIERELRYAYKMEALGTLSRGIAHEFNNFLGIIIGNTELALDETPSWSSLRLYLDEIKAATLRARDTVSQLLQFGRKVELEKRPVDLCALVRDSVKLLRASLPSSIEFSQQLPSSLKRIQANPTQIHQVLLNLCTNAAHAMEGKGTLQLAVSEKQLNKEEAIFQPGLQPGPYLCLSVSDTGHGIPTELLNKIFDPYFTTKQVGEGSGMGLAVVHGIVTAHGGTIVAESEQGEGSTFHVYFPAVEALQPTPRQQKQPLAPKGTEHILFVDDEELLVRSFSLILRSLGYQVECQTNPLETLEHFRQHADRYDLVITDMTMPGMSGDQLAQELLAIRHDIPILICTGYSEKLAGHSLQELGVRAILRKPIEKSALAQAIRNTLQPEPG